ncbi:MAG TPA: ribosome silencing factor [Dissulfurispiraceae bacterium]|nr:ribosome silencing factor [Dissulfurispiraceae bacterium]
MRAAKAALDKKSKETVILELKDLTVIADYFVICSGTNITQVKAIADHIENELLEVGIRPASIEGRENARWILMDYGDAVVHIFEEETRAYYELDKFWLDAPRVSINNEDKDSVGRKDKGAVSR